VRWGNPGTTAGGYYRKWIPSRISSRVPKRWSRMYEVKISSLFSSADLASFSFKHVVGPHPSRLWLKGAVLEDCSSVPC
jgi:hypothetical protein